MAQPSPGQSPSAQPDRPPRPVPPTPLFYLAVFVGGMLGGSLRYLLTLAFPSTGIGWTILGVDLAGAFVLALLLGGWLRRGHTSHPWRPFLATGILGSFTTWSTFMADVGAFGSSNGWLPAAAYAVAGTAAGLGAAAAGWWVACRTVPQAVTR